MEKVRIKTGEAISEILIGAKWESVEGLIPAKDVVIITDDNVKEKYGNRFPAFPVFSVLPGEVSKKFSVVEDLAEKLLKAGIGRDGFVLAIGGGVVCDLGGFLASIYMRGIRFGYVSTSLLSQVDASTGGKNGVNLGSTKNVLGNFRQPEFVICDPRMLKTLPEHEYLSGLAELIKTAIIGDRELFEKIEKKYDKIKSRDNNLLANLVTSSVRFKASVVSVDEKEAGLRRILNFGHTFGHAIELQTSVSHGFAVASGMELATVLSFEKGFISEEEMNRIINILKQFGLLVDHRINDGRIDELIMHDKKKTGTDINFVFTDGIGKASVRKIPVSELTAFYKRFRDKK